MVVGGATSLRYYVTERFIARLDWTLYTAYVADTRSTEYRAITAGLGFFFVFVGSTVAHGIAWQATRSSYAGLISIQADLRRVGEAIFALKPSRMTAQLPPELAFAVLAVAVVVSLFILKTRVRAVEIVT